MRKVIDLIGAVVLFALAIPVVMQYRILPIEGTPYWLFGVLFLLLSVNTAASLADFRDAFKNTMLVAVLVIVLGGVMWTAIVDRHKTAPVYGVHDIILQQEAAMRYLTRGKNPYKETYFGTPVESFRYAEINNDKAINPALYYFVMPPWYVLFPMPIYYVAVHSLGYFDGRMVSMLLMGVLLVSLWHWIKDKSIARLAVILTALSPAMIDYFIEGRSDVFALAFFVAALVFLEKKYLLWSALFFGLALASKQTIWFALPFVFMKTNVKYSVISCLVLFLFAMPFLVWDYKAFLDSVVFYLSGNAVHSYPVSGYGFGMVLRDMGIIKDIHAYYPFIIWQIVFGIPVIIALVLWLKKVPRMSTLLFGYAFFLMCFWYFSRYFNNSHLGYISMLFVIATAKYCDEINLV